MLISGVTFLRSVNSFPAYLSICLLIVFRFLCYWGFCVKKALLSCLVLVYSCQADMKWFYWFWSITYNGDDHNELVLYPKAGPTLLQFLGDNPNTTQLCHLYYYLHYQSWFPKSVTMMAYKINISSIAICWDHFFLIINCAVIIWLIPDYVDVIFSKCVLIIKAKYIMCHY